MIGRCKKSLGAGKEVIIDASTINAIFSRLDHSEGESLSVGGEKRDSEEKCLLKTVSLGGGRQQMREVRRPY